MEKRRALMAQLFAVATPLGFDAPKLRDLFRVDSLTMVPTKDIEAWIVRHNRAIPGEPHQGGKRTKGKYDKRRYLRKLLGDMENDGWPRDYLKRAALDPHAIDLSAPVVPAGAISKAIAQLWRMRHNGWEARGIAPIADTRKRVGRVSNPPTTEAQ